MRIPHCALYQVPHVLAFLSVAFLLDRRNLYMLVLGLGINQAVAQVDLAEPFCLFPQLCLHMRANWSPSLSSSIVRASGCSMCCRQANCRMLPPPAFLVLPSFRQISWRYAWMRPYHNWMVGLKSLFGRSIFLNFFSACTLIFFICL